MVEKVYKKLFRAISPLSGHTGGKSSHERLLPPPHFPSNISRSAYDAHPSTCQWEYFESAG